MTAPARTRTSAARKESSERAQAPERTRARADPREQRARRTRQPGKSGRSGNQRQPSGRRQSSGRGQSSRQQEAKTKAETRAKAKTGTKTEARTKAPSRPRQSSQPSRASKAKQLQTKVVSARAPFVVAVMTVLAAGIVGTLWLSISAVSNSYELRKAEDRVNALSERKETLQAQVSRMSSIPAVQRRARELGLVPGPEPAYLRVHPDGSVTLIGEPEPAKAAAPDSAPQQPSQQTSSAPEESRP
ncbi:hypothetical protein [Haloactinomyces albus]|uniref:Cell division protein FtsL n=1 Tax=Haloactinomyces albus TaxID=1352928 RepID=A0AAE4CNE5_9ACTN|nr:hypothetical protein [Haloactinomyces albus]MDR7300583.1 hypothetical protein [Haloactinomyces albus]